MIDTNFFIKNGEFTLSKIAQICGATLKDASNANIVISDLNTMDDASKGEICFFYDKKKKQDAQNIKATACITTQDLESFVPNNVVTLIVDNPKVAFLNLNTAMYSEKKPQATIASSAKIDATAELGDNCFVGEYVVIGKNVKIGSGAVIEPFTVIGDSCQIGSNCRFGANSSVAYAIMGNDCYVYSGARIGQDGFAFQTIGGVHKRIPQLGRVIIGNDVEIGANACVDRGALGDTIIGDGCKIDNLVQVAHNDKIGRGCILVSMTGIAGSTTLGDYVVCGGQVGIADHISIGSGAQIAAQSGVIRNLEAGSVVMGTPSVPLKDFMKQSVFLQKSIKK